MKKKLLLGLALAAYGTHQLEARVMPVSEKAHYTIVNNSSDPVLVELWL